MILVTGATGHLGNVLVRKLKENGEKIRVLVLPGESLISLQGMTVEVVIGDILDREIVKEAMKGIDYVYHLAGVISINPGAEKIMHNVNVIGARIVAEEALKSGVKRFVHASSIHAFRREPHGITIDENTPLALDSPTGSYDRTKAEGTKAVLEIVRKGLNAVIVCPTGIIGSHDYNNSEMGKTLVSFANRNVEILVDGVFDFVDVHDVANGMIQACEKGKPGEIYILSGTQTSIVQLHHMTQLATGENKSKIILPIKFALFFISIIQNFYRLINKKTRYTVYSLQTLLDNSVFSSAKAFRDLNYRPRPLQESVTDFINWYKFNRNKQNTSRKKKLKSNSKVSKVTNS